jgi:methyltransferase (TIGR00027 family)
MVSDVSRTAIGVARLRALESRRPDRLFDDPYAAAFVPEGTADAATDSVFRQHVAVRTRFYDDYLLTSGCRQVVLLAAGLDTRAFRLPWPPGIRLFELDLPELVAYKEDVLASRRAEPRCERTVIGVDLRDDWPARLVSAGFRIAEPTAWLVEGLLVYLSAADAANLLSRVTELSAPGSGISCEHHDRPRTTTGQERDPRLRRLLALWQGGLGTRTAAWLAEHDWHVEVHDGQRLARSYGRDEPGHRVSNLLIGTRQPHGVVQGTAATDDPVAHGGADGYPGTDGLRGG